MSRIGKQPIEVPAKVEINISNANVVSVKGPKGQLKETVDPEIKVSFKDSIINVERPTDQKRHKSLQGLYRTLIKNMVVGVTDGYKKNIELVGVGYRAAIQGSVLDLTIGYSHNVLFALPPEVKGSVVTEKGKNPTITLESNDKQLLGLVSAKIRAIRKPEPYKGKGIRYSEEYIRRKAGKSAAKSK